jgi:hypothetical protein
MFESPLEGQIESRTARLVHDNGSSGALLVDTEAELDCTLDTVCECGRGIERWITPSAGRFDEAGLGGDPWIPEVPHLDSALTVRLVSAETIASNRDDVSVALGREIEQVQHELQGSIPGHFDQFQGDSRLHPRLDDEIQPADIRQEAEQVLYGCVQPFLSPSRKIRPTSSQLS